MSMILLFYYLEACGFSDETCSIFEIYSLVDHSKLLVYCLLRNYQNFFFSVERSAPGPGSVSTA